MRAETLLKILFAIFLAVICYALVKMLLIDFSEVSREEGAEQNNADSLLVIDVYADFFGNSPEFVLWRATGVEVVVYEFLREKGRADGVLGKEMVRHTTNDRGLVEAILPLGSYAVRFPQSECIGFEFPQLDSVELEENYAQVIGRFDFTSCNLISTISTPR